MTALDPELLPQSNVDHSCSLSSHAEMSLCNERLFPGAP